MAVNLEFDPAGADQASQMIASKGSDLATAVVNDLYVPFGALYPSSWKGLQYEETRKSLVNTKEPIKTEINAITKMISEAIQSIKVIYMTNEGGASALGFDSYDISTSSIDATTDISTLRFDDVPVEAYANTTVKSAISKIIGILDEIKSEIDRFTGSVWTGDAASTFKGAVDRAKSKVEQSFSEFETQLAAAINASRAEKAEQESKIQSALGN